MTATWYQTEPVIQVAPARNAPLALLHIDDVREQRQLARHLHRPGQPHLVTAAEAGL